MPSLIAQIYPFEPVNILNGTRITVREPEQEAVSQEFIIHFLNVIPVDGSDLPVKSTVENFALLQPEATLTPEKISLINENGYLSSFPDGLPLFSRLECDTGHSVNIFEGNKLFPAATQVGSLELLQRDGLVKISDNLVVMLQPPKSVSGMMYADRYWTTEKIPNYFNVIKKKTVNDNENNPVIPRNLHEVGGVKVKQPRYKPSFWDLIFVLLQPPLIFGKTENILLPGELYKYQTVGVKFLISNEHALLADDMGTGKTVMSTVALKLLMHSNKIRTALILCPPSVLYEWKNHIANWFPEAIACFVRGTQEIRSLEWNTKAHIYVTTYDTIRSDIENGLLSKDKLNYFDIVIVDEAHHIKNLNTGRSKAIRKLRPNIRWALTGTPIQNSVEDMAAIFEFLYPGYINQFDLYPERVKQKVAPYFLRRRKQDVISDLPPKIRQDIWLDMSNEQRIEYIRVEKSIQMDIEGLGERVTKQHVFSQIQRLKQICNFASKQNTSPKIEELKEQIEEIIRSDNKVIVFSQYVDEGVNKIVSALKGYGVAIIVGGQTDGIRSNEIEKFKKLAEYPVLVASVKSGGEGLNLTEASYVIHFDHWWNPAVMWQAEDRTHRRGQKSSVNVYSYWMNETIDERIYNILQRKGILIRNIVDGLSENTIEAMISLNDLLEIVGVKKPVDNKPSFDPQKWLHLSAEQIHQKLFEVSPREFEELVERLMHYLGYPNVKVTKRTGDGGIDVISTRIIGSGIERIAAQCKRYKSPIGVAVAREFLGAIQDDKTIVKGYIVTTSEFTSECINYCLRHQIEMIPGVKMAEYVKRFGLEFNQS